jgi:hypothetical protein
MGLAARGGTPVRAPRLAVLLLGFLLAGSAEAVPVTIVFTGSVDAILDPDGLTPGFLQAGTPVTGSFTFESTLPGSGTAPSPRSYFMTNSGFTLDFPNGSAPASGIAISVENNGDFGFDTVEVATGLQPLAGFLVGPGPSFLRIDLVVLNFSDPTGTALSNQRLPTSPDQWELLGNGSFQITGCPFTLPIEGYCFPPFDPVYVAFGSIDSATVVPEPASLLLLLSGLLGLRRLGGVERSGDDSAGDGSPDQPISSTP